MPLQLNLLHEEISQERQRKRDPLKISMYVAAGLAGLLALNYLWSAYRTLTIKAHLSAVERDWAKVEPQVSAAQKRAEQLNGIISTARTLDQFIDSRFFWAPILETISRCVTPNLQITNLEGAIDEQSKAITVSLEGTAAGREPRAVAEDFRQMLLEQLGKEQPGVKVEFRTLEDLDSLVSVGANNVAAAHFIIAVNLNTGAKTPASGPAERKSKSKKEES